MFKSGWKTSEFWVTVLATVGGIGSSIVGFIPASSAALVALGSTMAYALSRGIAKKKNPPNGK
jgi:hypothetical protein